MCVYAEALKGCDAIDFQDIMTKALELITTHSAVREAFQAQFSHVLVDEFQDTNKVQYDLMRALVSGNRVTVVGDDDQSIFAFQGATGRDVFTHMRADYDGIASVRLEENYRSTGIIVAASSSLIHKSLSREQKQAISMHEQGDPITVVECSCAAAEADYVLKAIEWEATQRKIPLSEMAILYRKKVTGQYFQTKLLEKGIPFNHHVSAAATGSAPSLRPSFSPDVRPDRWWRVRAGRVLLPAQNDQVGDLPAADRGQPQGRRLIREGVPPAARGPRPRERRGQARR